MAFLVSQERLMELKLSFWSVQRAIISKKVKAVPVTSAVPSLEILLYPGALGIL